MDLCSLLSPDSDINFVLVFHIPPSRKPIYLIYIQNYIIDFTTCNNGLYIVDKSRVLQPPSFKDIIKPTKSFSISFGCFPKSSHRSLYPTT